MHVRRLQGGYLQHPRLHRSQRPACGASPQDHPLIHGALLVVLWQRRRPHRGGHARGRQGVRPAVLGELHDARALHAHGAGLRVLDGAHPGHRPPLGRDDPTHRARVTGTWMRAWAWGICNGSATNVGRNLYTASLRSGHMPAYFNM